jgi:hypothetical protein
MERCAVGFFRVWLLGYTNPGGFIEELRSKPAPLWGVYGQLGRALGVSLLFYLPLALLGRVPSTPSAIAFLPTESYFATSIVLAPLFIIMQWLLLSAVVHVILRLTRRHSDIDQILNITGMVALVVGAFLILWDWLWVSLKWQNLVLLGVSHLIIVAWAVGITTLGFKRILGVPAWLGVLLNLLWVLLGEPLGAIFMRAPI